MNRCFVLNSTTSHIYSRCKTYIYQPDAPLASFTLEMATVMYAEAFKQFQRMYLHDVAKPQKLKLQHMKT
jgi:hypothetical protein